MKENFRTQRLRVGGMTCVNCQNKIEKKLQSMRGVKNARVRYSAGTVEITYDESLVTLSSIMGVIEKLDYRVLGKNEQQGRSVRRVFELLTIIVLLYVIFSQFGILNLLVPSQLADTKMGYGMLFIIGLVTSVHCIAMCGGINLSQCIPKGAAAEESSRMGVFAPTFLYNLGRIISYTTVGFILGGIGWLFGGGNGTGIPVSFQGILKLIAGVFMVIMGLNMLSLFPWLRKFGLSVPRVFHGKNKAKDRGPLFVGILNGLMPCGPLQSMQIVALATANPIAGALSMFMFSLGTVPLMLGLGSIVSALGKKFTEAVMSAGAVLVVVLGLAMLSQGTSLSGIMPESLLLPIIIALCVVGVISVAPFGSDQNRKVVTAVASVMAVLLLLNLGTIKSVFSSENSNKTSGVAVNAADGPQLVDSTLSVGSYPNITVQAGIPVKWNINAPDGSINGCNNRMFIKEYSVEHTFKPGENIIEFTPEKVGKVQYSCWMGMIRGTINVVEGGEEAATENINDPDEYFSPKRGGASCH